MAVIGQVLAAPEAGWKRYEETDANFVYTGTWGSRSNAEYSGGAQKTSANNILNNKIQFKFYGSKIRIISSIYSTYSNNIKITIDGVSETYSLSYTTSLNKALVYEKTGLSKENHIVTIEKMSNGTYNPDFIWDAIDIDESGTMLNINTPLSQNKILIQSPYEINLKSIINKENSIPKMSSNESPSGLAEASSSTGSPAWHAFNGVADGEQGWYTAGSTNKWISYTFPNKTLIDKYEIYVSTHGIGVGSMPQSFRFEGSNDKINWEILDVQNMTRSDWGTNRWITFNLDKQKVKKYKAYRVFINSNIDGGNYIRIPEMIMSGNERYIIDNITPTEQNFIKYGVSPNQLSSIDYTLEFKEKHQIQDVSTKIGNGNSYKHIVNLSKGKINKIKFN